MAKEHRQQKVYSAFTGWRIVGKLEELKDLLRHQSRWAHQHDLARPLEKLGISENDPHRYELIRQRINRLLPIAMNAAQDSGTPTRIHMNEQIFGTYPIEYEKNDYDLFIHYDLLRSKDEGRATTFDTVINTLDQMIGFYSEIRTRLLIGYLNPLKLIAWILRIPITILEYMGFDAQGNTAEKVLSIMLHGIWILFLSVLTVYFSGKSQLVKAFLELIK